MLPRAAVRMLSAKLQFRQDYENELIPGFSIDIENADGHGDYTQCLNSVSGVVKTWKSQSYLPASRNDSTTGANTHDQPVNASILHGMTGVKDLHDAGIFGRGLTIAMVDTGVDYGHPALGGSKGEGYKIRYGIDLVGDNWQIGDAPQLDLDPYTESPEASLGHYRVSGGNRVPIQSDIIIKAVLIAYSRKVDVVSLSLTLNTGPYPDDPLSEVLARISQEGNVLVVVAAGNYGWQGPFSAKAPASAPNVLAVGSVNSAYSVQSRPRASSVVENATTGESQSTDFAWAPATPGRFPDSPSLQATTLDTSVPDDACSSSENDPPLSETAVVLVRRGGCTFDVKMKSMAARGATYVLIYDNVDQPLFELDNTFDGILGAGSVTAPVGKELMRALSEGSEVTMMMDSGFRGVPFIKVGENSLPPGQVNGRGSWGPTGLGDSMPSLWAPEQSIWSTIRRSWGGFGTLSGTSMAAPYIAGCAALVKQVHPGLRSSEISRLLTSTARPLNFNDGTNKTCDFLAPVAQQGNGVVDALGAARTKTARSRVLIGHGRTPTSSLEAHLSKDNSSSLASEEFLQNLLAGRHADITVSPQSLRIGPGETALVRVTADIKTLDDLRSRCPLYSGFIGVNDGRSDAGLTISYMGIGCSMRQMAVMPPGWNKTFVTAATAKQAEGESYDAVPISPNTTFLLQGHRAPKTYMNASTLLPTLNVELAMFSRALTVEVFPAAAAGNDRGVPVFSPDQTAKPGGFGRSTTNLLTWSGQLENGSWADEGPYKFK
ncbi:Minor extracellular protease vpr, partial [Colletotrichum shisoi]